MADATCDRITSPQSGRIASAVLISAGLDSAVLAAAEAGNGRVHPIYVSCGLAWEAEEVAALHRLLTAAPYVDAAPLATLAFPVTDLYPASHWALRGEPPGYDTADEEVYLAGRNLILLSTAAIYCAQHGIGRLAIGPLAGNPFPDATPSFFEAMAAAASIGLAHRLVIAAPFLTMDKAAVISRGVKLGVPLELTLSCMNPRAGRHCGRCSKCRERRDAFRQAGVADATPYAAAP
jgi:7-cyano-7-deazaguanine synthase